MNFLDLYRSALGRMLMIAGWERPRPPKYTVIDVVKRVHTHKARRSPAKTEVMVTVLTHNYIGKSYPSNGNRETARRRRQMGGAVRMDNTLLAR